MLQHLRRIPELRQLKASELRSLTAFCTVICMPKQRWIVRVDRRVDRALYLLRGAITTTGPDRRLVGVDPCVRFYPGCRSARTEEPSQVLAIDADYLDFLLDESRGRAPETQAVEPWLSAFLQSNMLASVSVSAWGAILDALVPARFDAGQRLIKAGQPASDCFVLKEGRAVVHRQGRRLRMLRPGDFFGEDALLMGSARTASVTALGPVTALVMSAQVFAREIQAALIVGGDSPYGASGDDRRIDVARLPCTPHVVSAAARDMARRLEQGVVYRVTGRHAALREFVAFILCAFGHTAYVDR